MMRLAWNWKAAHQHTAQAAARAHVTATRLRISVGAVATTSITGCYPSCCTLADDQGRPLCSDRHEAVAKLRTFCVTPTSISQRPSRPCANIGCPFATHAPADHRGHGSSYRLRMGAFLSYRGVINHQHRLAAADEPFGLDQQLSFFPRAGGWTRFHPRGSNGRLCSLARRKG
jgi:hypothetical protein